MTTQNRHPILDELADASRRAILEQLRSGAKSVMTLVERTGLKQPNVSNHLAKMRDRGIVVAQREGRQVFYSLADPLIEAVLHTALSGQGFASEQVVSSSEMETWAENYFNAISTSDETTARKIVGELLDRHVAIEDLYIDIFQSSLGHIGDLYIQGRLTEAEEHMSTAITERQMARASQFYPAALPNGRKAVMGSVEGNWHAIGLRMISDILQTSGWHTYYLGASVPTNSFVKMVAEQAPDVVVISCMLEENAAGTVELIRRLRELRSGLVKNRFEIGVGGGYVNSYPDFARASGADFTAPDLRAFLAYLSERFADRRA